MIQRIQSLYMLVSVILTVVCQSLPLGRFYTAEGGVVSQFYNLWLRNGATGTLDFSPWALFALLVVVCSLTFIDIFLYHRRALQMRVLTLCMVLLVGYYAYLGFLIVMAHNNGNVFTPNVTAALPFVCIVLDYLAFQGVLKDEMLVRSRDRLR